MLLKRLGWNSALSGHLNAWLLLQEKSNTAEISQLPEFMAHWPVVTFSSGSSSDVMYQSFGGPHEDPETPRSDRIPLHALASTDSASLQSVASGSSRPLGENRRLLSSSTPKSTYALLSPDSAPHPPRLDEGSCEGVRVMGCPKTSRP